jgi:hypothetical protein
MTTKQSQMIAIKKGTRSEYEKLLTKVYQTIEKRDQFLGLHKEYVPLDEDSTEKLPPESKKVQASVDDLLDSILPVATRAFDVEATIDATNGIAKADIVVDGRIIAKNVSVQTLLFIEKQLMDFRTLVGKLPTLATDQDWSVDPASGLSKTAVRETHRTKKVTSHTVVVPATDKHPAQVAQTTEDVIVGHWHSINTSGETSPMRVKELLAKIGDLQRAVQFARQEANSVDVTDVRIGSAILGYVFAK